MKKALIIIFIIIFSYACSNEKQIIFLNLENGSGLSEKTNVIFKGKEIGTIKKIDIVDNNLIAKIAISRDFQIYKESEFYIVSTDVLGSKSIEIKNPLNGHLCYKYDKDTFMCKVKPSSIELMIKDVLSTTETLIDTLKKD